MFNVTIIRLVTVDCTEFAFIFQIVKLRLCVDPQSVYTIIDEAYFYIYHVYILFKN